jgi:hypothetical protein
MPTKSPIARLGFLFLPLEQNYFLKEIGLSCQSLFVFFG